MTFQNLSIEYAASAGQLSEEDLRRAGPYTRKVIGRLKRLGKRTGGDCGSRPGRAGRRGMSPLGLVLARAALDLARAACDGLTGQAHEAFFREDFPFDEPIPSTFGEALVRALPRGERALEEVVINQSIEMFGRGIPRCRLFNRIRRRIELFELLALECQQLRVY